MRHISVAESTPVLRAILTEADAAGPGRLVAGSRFSIVLAHQHTDTAERVVMEDRARLDEHTTAPSNDKNPR